MFRRKMLWAAAALVVLGVGSFLLFRPKAHLEVVKIYPTVEPAPPPASKKQSAPLQSAQSSCCESGDAICCQTPGSPCCPPANVSELTSAEAIEGATPLAVETSDVDTTQNYSAPLSEDKVVPDAVVQEAERFRAWEKKREVHQQAWTAHRQEENRLDEEFQRQYAALLMTYPIERRQALVNQMERQFIESQVPQDIWDAYINRLYSYGLDFQTEYSPEESDALSKQIHHQMFTLSEKLMESAKEGQKFLHIQKELDTESDTF